jgi:hypothetical protein
VTVTLTEAIHLRTLLPETHCSSNKVKISDGKMSVVKFFLNFLFTIFQYNKMAFLCREISLFLAYKNAFAGLLSRKKTLMPVPDHIVKNIIL